jgi:hypothetical protein
MLMYSAQAVTRPARERKKLPKYDISLMRVVVPVITLSKTPPDLEGVSRAIPGILWWRCEAARDNK